ncbi:hypothetical protein NBRC116592_09890 [Colwellia sp. KU-HH00111]|uniref:PKD domain-containing protein n=1 Tax=Colwellia sp. KU-HH00111 TaxID=3127652 RepID=UPI00310B412B
MNNFKYFMLLGLFFIITSCGGGGGGSSNETPSNPTPTNTPPTVNAGSDQTVDEGMLVQLVGAGNDTEGSVSYLWQQVSGTTVNLSDTTISNPTFTAPQVTETVIIEFSLTVKDTEGLSVVDTINVTVNNQVNAGNTESYLFYTHGLHAVDSNSPASPVLVEATENLITESLFGITIPSQRESIIKNAVYNQATKVLTGVHNYAVIYPKTDGHLYKISALKSGSLTPVQVSNENSAQKMCNTRSDRAKSDFSNVENSQYVYSLPGNDNTCDTADDVWKMVTISMDSTQAPIIAKTPVIDFMNSTTGAIDGWLVNDASALKRCDASFDNCSLIASVVSSVNYKLKMADNFYLLDIDGQLFSYNIADNTLSSSIFTPTNGTNITVAASDGVNTYFGHENSLYQFPVDGSSVATVLTTDTNEIQIVTPAVNSIVYQVGTNGLGQAIQSIPKTGGTVINLAMISANDDLVMMGVDNNLIYYNIRKTTANQGEVVIEPVIAGIINEIGSNKNERVSAAWVGGAWSSEFNLNTNNSYGNTKTAFLVEGFNINNTGGGHAGATLTAVDARSGVSGVVLGQFETTEELQYIYCLGFEPSVLCSVTHTIDPAPALPNLPIQTDIYYLNTETAGSLTRVTNTEDENELIMP